MPIVDNVAKNEKDTMDREIPKEIRQKERRNSVLKYVAIVAVVIVALGLVISMMQDTVDAKDLEYCKVEIGDIEESVNASGKLSPAFEQVITSPIGSRIVEVYCKVGDEVAQGSPLLKLDLQSAQTDYDKLVDQAEMKRLELEQQRMNNRTYLSDLQMRIKVAEMSLNRLEVELRNEQYLDSIGSGTTDKVREADFSCQSKRLELEQLRTQYENEKQVKEAGLSVKELELSMLNKSLAEMRRTLNDAQIRSPYKATLTFISNQVGAQVAQGSQVAIIADLKHFKVDCEVAEMYASRVRVGNMARVRVNSQDFTGVVSNVEPTAKNGVTAFSVQLENDTVMQFRSGLRADIYVYNGVSKNVKRIKNGAFFKDPGHYTLYVRRGEELVVRDVQLGASNYDYIEVERGLEPGDEVVVSDMSEYNSERLKIRE